MSDRADHRRQSRDRASIRRLPGLHGVETLAADYRRQHFKPHAHDEYVFGQIEAGVHAVRCRGGMNRVPGGSLVTMRPGDVHHGGESGWRQRMIYIGEAGIRALFSDIAGRDLPATLDFGAAFHRQPALALRFHALHEVLHRAPGTLAREVALVELMRAVLATLAPSALPEARREPAGNIADAVEFLRTRVEEEVTLAELCAVTDLRRRQTIEAFRRHTGLPPHAWHIQQKILRVKGLLRAGMSATAAAAELGFADQSHMTRHFLAITGVTSGAYARSRDRG